MHYSILPTFSSCYRNIKNRIEELHELLRFLIYLYLIVVWISEIVSRIRFLKTDLDLGPTFTGLQLQPVPVTGIRN
jgi:hypothetical protein